MNNRVNSLCSTCVRFGRDCKGMAEEPWTGCVYRAAPTRSYTIHLDGHWYAVQRDPSDDWSTGSYDRDEAVRMARAQLADYPDTLVAVVDNSTSNPVCVDEIRDF